MGASFAVVLAAVLCVCASAEPSFQQAKVLLVKFSDNEHGSTQAELVRSFSREFYLDWEEQAYKGKFIAQADQHTYHVHYRMGNDLYQVQTVRDPRFVHGDWHDDAGKRVGGLVKQKTGFLSITVPAKATEIVVAPPGMAHKHSTQERTPNTFHIKVPETAYWTSHPKWSVQGTPKNAEFVRSASNQVGEPGRTKNLVIVPGGYKDDDLSKSKYLAATSMVLNMLRNGHNLLMSAPWDRYIELMNYLVVWQPSPEAGADFPIGRNGGGKPGVGEVKVNDNLDCSYGEEVLRLLGCDRGKGQELAAVAGVDPTTSTTMVLVNEEVYGGSGGNRFGSIYAGKWEQCDSPCLSIGPGCTCVGVTLNGRTYGWKMASDNKLLQVFIHELGHSDADLSDEYDYGIAETEQLELKNCHHATTKLPWQHWVGQPKGVDNPVALCSYTNYFKPTPGLCLMENEGSNEYCPVCSENVIRAIYRDTTAFAAPRCPRSGETLVITDKDEVHYLVANGKFLTGGVTAEREESFLLAGAHQAPGNPRANSDGRIPLRQDKGDIEHFWTRPDFSTEIGSKVNPVPALSINGKKLGLGEHTFRFTVIDRSEFALYSKLPSTDILNKGRNKTSEYKVRVVSQSDPKWGRCRVSLLETTDGDDSIYNKCTLRDNLGTTYYCGECQAGRVCNDTYPTQPFEAQANLNGAIENIEGTLFGIGGACIVGGLILFLGLWFLLGRYLTRNVTEVIPYPPVLRYARWVMIGTAVVTMLVSIAIIIVSVYVYSEMTAFGKALVLVILIFSCILYVVAFIGFTAAWYRSKAMLIVNGILLAIVVIVLLVVAIVVFYTGQNIDTANFKEPLREAWLKQVKKNPKSACTFQAQFKCSGFEASCHNKFHSECPTKCEVTNANYPHPCYGRLQTEVEDNFAPAGIVVIVLAIFMFIGLVINWALCCCLRQRKLRIRHRLSMKPQGWGGTEEAEWNRLRAANIMRNLSEAERKAMKEEFKKVDKDKSGKVSPQELQVFFKRAFGQNLSREEANEAVRRLDADGDGKVSFNEFITMYGNEEQEQAQKKKLLADPSIAHLDAVEADSLYNEFRRIDKDGSGVISEAELKLFYRRLYHCDPDPDDVRRALVAVDNDHSGTINFFEFVQMFAGKIRVKSPRAGGGIPGGMDAV